MIDHVSIRVKDVEKSKKFYETVLSTLGYIHNIGSKEEKYYGFGFGEDPILEIIQETTDKPANSVHIAFKAKTKKEIHDFYTTAIENGAQDNGTPGLRPQYTPTYYAAFVLDFDGNNIEICLYE